MTNNMDNAVLAQKDVLSIFDSHHVPAMVGIGMDENGEYYIKAGLQSDNIDTSIFPEFSHGVRVVVEYVGKIQAQS